jgi:nucleoside-diphosphate-sugar epimerase
LATILVTGATGFIGGAAAARLLSREEADTIMLLVRGPTREDAEARARRSIARFTDASLPNDRRRLRVINGDLAQSGDLADEQIAEVTHVLHIAGNTSLRSVQGARRTNVDGTLALARRMLQAPRLERFLYVGTAYICGDQPSAVVCEDDFPKPCVRHLVEYTRSKAECELLLGELPQLPLVIARPSIVVGHSSLGCGPSASIFWYYRTLDLLRRVPAPLDTRKDIVPVDYVAEALLLLLFKPSLCHRRYHISAGSAASVSWREMGAVFDQYHGIRDDNPWRLVDVATLKRERVRFRELIGQGDEDWLLGVMEPLLALSGSGAQIFDNSRLLGEGMSRPPRFTDYLPACINAPSGCSVYEQILSDVWGSTAAPLALWRSPGAGQPCPTDTPSHF